MYFILNNLSSDITLVIRTLQFFYIKVPTRSIPIYLYFKILTLHYIILKSIFYILYIRPSTTYTYIGTYNIYTCT